MEEKIVLTKEELEQIIYVKNSYDNLSNIFGDIELRMLNLQQEKQRFIEEYNTLRKQETDLIQQIENKYGKGEISLETGEFKPKKTSN